MPPLTPRAAAQVDPNGDGLTAPRHYTATSPPGAKYLQCTTKKARHTAPAAARCSSCYSSSGRSSSVSRRGPASALALRGRLHSPARGARG